MVVVVTAAEVDLTVVVVVAGDTVVEVVDCSKVTSFSSSVCVSLRGVGWVTYSAVDVACVVVVVGVVMLADVVRFPSLSSHSWKN